MTSQSAPFIDSYVLFPSSIFALHEEILESILQLF